jgi:hypothetical protein
MPRYDFACPACGWTGERFAKISERDAPQACTELVIVEDGALVHQTETCGGKLDRTEISRVAEHQNKFVAGAVMKSGAVVPGTFLTKR